MQLSHCGERFEAYRHFSRELDLPLDAKLQHLDGIVFSQKAYVGYCPNCRAKVVFEQDYNGNAKPLGPPRSIAQKAIRKTLEKYDDTQRLPGLVGSSFVWGSNNTFPWNLRPVPVH